MVKYDFEKPVLTEEQVSDYLTSLREKGLLEDTISLYERNLKRFFAFLGNNRSIDKNTVKAFRDYLITQKKPQTVNTHLSAVNGFLEYLGLRQFQFSKFVKVEPKSVVELTREEYLKLLLAARQIKDQRVYLLIKLFALTGLRVSLVKHVTVEAVKQQCIICGNDENDRYEMPAELCEEFKDYIQKEAILSGPVFRNKDGKPLARASINRLILNVASRTDIEAEKCNPKCLGKLFFRTKKEIENEVKKIAQQMQGQLIMQEQLVIGWKKEG